MGILKFLRAQAKTEQLEASIHAVVVDEFARKTIFALKREIDANGGLKIKETRDYAPSDCLVLAYEVSVKTLDEKQTVVRITFNWMVAPHVPRINITEFGERRQLDYSYRYSQFADALACILAAMRNFTARTAPPAA
jgi:hypothetical protein